MKAGKYTEEELLPLSGLQHYAYCRRQWALIHVEQQWQENILTAHGRVLHERAHDPTRMEKRSGVIITRSMPLSSSTLGVIGVADVVEFHRVETEDNAIRLPKRKGWWRPQPVEYKRGKPKITNIDRIQLCAQAMCLEEMLGVDIVQGALFYWQIRSREYVELDQKLRHEVASVAEDMHRMFAQGYTPPPQENAGCRRCSLKDLCLPALASRRSVQDYLGAVMMQIKEEA